MYEKSEIDEIKGSHAINSTVEIEKKGELTVKIVYLCNWKVDMVKKSRDYFADFQNIKW